MRLETVAYPTLDYQEIATVERYGSRRPTRAGEVLYRAGDRDVDWIVVVDGSAEAVAPADGVDDRLALAEAGGFLGELAMLTGQRMFATAQGVDDGEVIAVPWESFRRLLAEEAELAGTILEAFTARRTLNLARDIAWLRIVGSRFQRESSQLREWVARNRIPHRWIDVEGDTGKQVLADRGLTANDLPTAIVGDVVLTRATSGNLATHLGMAVGTPEHRYDVVVVGAGPAGLAASVYGASEGLDVLAVEAVAPGGQAALSSLIENYLGFPAGVAGEELANRASTQAIKFGAVLTSPCSATGVAERDGHLVVTMSDGTEVTGRALVVATGARYRRLPLPELEQFETAGVHYACTEIEMKQCARGPAVVVGGGNSAGQAALFLADNGSNVILVVRGDDLGENMSAYLVERIRAHPRVDARTRTEVIRLEGDRELRGLQLRGADGSVQIVMCAALFSFIGAEPASQWLSGTAALDADGYVRTDRSLGEETLDEEWHILGREPLPFETSRPGLFAVGDVRSGSIKRVAAAVGEGSAAIRSVHTHLAYVH